MPRALRTRCALGLSLSSLMLACGAAAGDVAVSNQVNGSVTPPTVPGAQDLTNGDFFIQHNDLAPVTGDGVDETTFWVHYLTNDPGWPAFEAAGGPITTALMAITLTQFYPVGPITDLVRPLNLYPIIPMPHFLVAGETGTLTINLLDYYTSEQLLDELAAFSGRLQMVYADDAIVSSVAIRIIRSECPCPADFDASGGTPDASDIDAYFTTWLAGDPAADVDCSGGTPDATDIDVFFMAWLAGGC